MHKSIEETLKFLPTDIKELERRAAFSTAFQGTWATPSFEVETNNGLVKYYGWNDGGGQSYSLWFTEHNTALITFFDHECMFNFYADEPEDQGLQEAFYEGIPKEFKEFVYDKEETYENLNISTSDGHEIYTASGVIWLEDGQWHVNETYAKLSDEKKDDGGIKYCLGALTFLNTGNIEEYRSNLEKEWVDDEAVVGLDTLVKIYNDSK